MSCNSVIETGGLMPGHKIILCVQAFLLSFNFGFPIFAQTGVTKPGTATISGRVVMKGEPARNVLVYLQPQQGRRLPIRTLSSARGPTQTGNSASRASRRDLIESLRSLPDSFPPTRLGLVCKDDRSSRSGGNGVG